MCIDVSPGLIRRAINPDVLIVETCDPTAKSAGFLTKDQEELLLVAIVC